MSKLLKVTALTGMLTLLRMMFGFVISKIVAIYAGPVGLAMLGQLQNLIAAVGGILSAPTGVGVIKYTAEHHTKGIDYCSSWWRAALHWVLVLSGIIIPLGIIFADKVSELLFNDSSWSWIITVIIVLLPVSALGTTCVSIINGLQQYRRYIAVGALSTLFSGSIMILLIINGNLTGALLAVAVQSSLIGAVSILCNIKQPWFKLRYLFGTSEKKHRKDIAGFMLMALVSSITMPVSLMLVRNMIVAQVGWVEAGHWQAVWKISEVYISVITMALSTYYLPRLASLTSVDDIIKEINATARIVLPLIIIIALCIYFLRDFVIWALFTKDFYDARNLFSVQLFGDVIKVISWLYAYPMLARGAVKWFVATEFLSSIVFVATSFVFIRYYGVHGANYGYLVMYLVYFLVVFTNVKRFSR